MKRTLLTFTLLVFAVGPALGDDNRGADDDFGVPSMGFQLVDLSKDVKAYFQKQGIKLPKVNRGIWVVGIVARGPAAKAGIKQFDLISVFNGKLIKDADDLRRQIKSLEIGKEQKLRVRRLVTRGKKQRWATATITVIPAARRDVFLSALDKTTDDVRGFTTYKHFQSPRTVNSRSSFHLYIFTEKNEPPVLRLKIQYTAKDWLFIQRYFLKTDAETHVITPPARSIERDNDARIWEWYDTAVDRNLAKIIDAVIAAENVTLQYEGKQYKKDREIEQDERMRLFIVKTSYKILGGKWPPE